MDLRKSRCSCCIIAVTILAVRAKFAQPQALLKCRQSTVEECEFSTRLLRRALVEKFLKRLSVCSDDASIDRNTSTAAVVKPWIQRLFHLLVLPLRRAELLQGMMRWKCEQWYFDDSEWVESYAGCFRKFECGLRPPPKMFQACPAPRPRKALRSSQMVFSEQLLERRKPLLSNVRKFEPFRQNF